MVTHDHDEAFTLDLVNALRDRRVLLAASGWMGFSVWLSLLWRLQGRGKW